MKDDTQKQKITVVFAPDVHQRMKELAEKHERSFNGEVMWALREYIAQQKKEELQMQEAVADIEKGLPLSALKEELKSHNYLFHATEYDQSVFMRDQGLYVYEPGKGGKRIYVETFKELLNVVPESSRWTTKSDTDARTISMMRSVYDRMQPSKDVSQKQIDRLKAAFYGTMLPAIQEKGWKKWVEENLQATINDTVEELTAGILAVIDEDDKFHQVGHISKASPRGKGPHIQWKGSFGKQESLTVLCSIEWAEQPWEGTEDIYPAEIAYRDPDPMEGADSSPEISLEVGMLVDDKWHDLGHLRLGDVSLVHAEDLELEKYSRRRAEIEWTTSPFFDMPYTYILFPQTGKDALDKERKKTVETLYEVDVEEEDEEEDEE